MSLAFEEKPLRYCRTTSQHTSMHASFDVFSAQCSKHRIGIYGRIVGECVQEDCRAAVKSHLKNSSLHSDLTAEARAKAVAACEVDFDAEARELDRNAPRGPINYQRHAAPPEWVSSTGPRHWQRLCRFGCTLRSSSRSRCHTKLQMCHRIAASADLDRSRQIVRKQICKCENRSA